MMSDVDQHANLAEASAGSAQLTHLLGRVARNDRQALKELYNATSAKLYGVCLRVLGSEPDAQDTLQDVFVTVWRKAAGYDPGKASPITWLCVIARNKAIDRLRARRAPTEDLDRVADLADNSPLATEVIESAQDARRLADCLDELEERAKTVIRSAFFDGATYPELAEREDVPLPTMKSWIRRGLLRLRGCMER